MLICTLTELSDPVIVPSVFSNVKKMEKKNPQSSFCANMHFKNLLKEMRLQQSVKSLKLLPKVLEIVQILLVDSDAPAAQQGNTVRTHRNL